MKNLLTSVLLLLSFSCYSQATWTLKSPFPGSAPEIASAFSVGGKGYIGLGRSPGQVIHDDFWQYDPGTDTWTQVASFGGGMRYGAVSFVINDTAYVGTGWSAVSHHKDFWKYDAGNNIWIQVADFAGYDSYSNSAVVINGKAYVGIGYSPYNNDWYEYDPQSDSWTQKASFPGTYRQACTAFVLNGKAYVGHGIQDNGSTYVPYKDFYEYDPVLDTWTQIPDFAGTPRWGVTAFTLNGKAYLVGGYDYNVYNNECWEFDPFTYTWTQLPNFPGLPRYGCAAFTIGNVAYLGTGSGGTYYNDFYKFAFSEDRFMSGRLYYDDNNNDSLDAGEAPVTYTIVEVNPGPEYYSSGIAGSFEAAGVSSLYTISIPYPPAYYSVSPATDTADVTVALIDTNTLFAFHASAVVNDVRIVLTPVNNVRAGQHSFYNINYTNVGTVAMSGTIDMTYDSAFTFVHTVPADTNVVQGPYSLQWSYSNLLPGEMRTFNVMFDVATSLMMNDTTLNSVVINPVIGDSVPTDNYDSETQIAVGSFDPNDKQVDQVTITPQQAADGDWLEYVIRFQNTGNADAINIRLADTLSSNLYIPSFEMLASSHPCTWEIHGSGILTWHFDNIMLPDSNSNEALSHGFVKYRIKPQSTLALGDLIENTAGIYFDYNPPVITNTAITSVAIVSSVAQVDASKINLYPNPSSGIVYISGLKNGASGKIRITDAMGRVVLSKTEEKIDATYRLNVTGIGSGLYFLEIEQSGDVKTSKLVIR